MAEQSFTGQCLSKPCNETANSTCDLSGRASNPDHEGAKVKRKRVLDEGKRCYLKEKRRNQKKRQKQRKKEEAKKQRQADRAGRIEKAVERRIQEIKAEQETQAGQSNANKRPSTSQQGERSPRKTARTAALKEIKSFHVTTRSHLGTGSYGSCYLALYRGMNVVIKNLKVRAVSGETQKDAEQRVREELKYEARIINKLGDHPGLPLLYGICSEQPPYRLVMQFHGEKDCSSLTIASALVKKTISDAATWITVIREVTDALDHVHRVGFLHNDVKSNNVVLDNASAKYQPVLIDFGKSLPVSGCRGPRTMSTETQRRYKKQYPHIAPEIVAGTAGQTYASDVFSIGFMGKVIFEKANWVSFPKCFCEQLVLTQQKGHH